MNKEFLELLVRTEAEPLKGDFGSLLKKLREDMPNIIAHMELTAELTKIKYDSLVKQGFTEAQAIELSKKLF